MMKRDQTSQGAGLAIFSLLLLVASFVMIIKFQNFIVAAITAFLATILAAAAYIETRRVNGPKKFALVVLIFTVAGTLFSLLWTGSIDKLTNRGNGTSIIREDPHSQDEKIDNRKKLNEMEEVINDLEDSITPPEPPRLPEPSLPPE
jgi:predicted PurR-regulated permease PerM